jgi:hypothetical protein
MTDTDADKFRKKAEERRKLADRSVSQLDKDYWLRLAADWIKLAENAEERRSKFRPLKRSPATDFLERLSAARIRSAHSGEATTLSGAWRPRDPVDDDQGGARA